MSDYKLTSSDDVIEIGTGRVIPSDMRNRHRIKFDAWIAAGNTPDPVDPVIVTTDMVKAEARRRILDNFPEWKQANMTARMVELNKIRADAGSWTANEQTEVAAIQSAWDWVKSVRAASDGLELSLPADYLDDGHWPAPVV